MSKGVKSLLERMKAKFEEELGRKLTWDEFFERIAMRLGVESILELNEEEAKIIKELVIEGRKSWRRSKRSA